MATVYCDLDQMRPEAGDLVRAAMEKNGSVGRPPPGLVVVNPALAEAVAGLLGPHGIDVAGCAGCLAWEIWFVGPDEVVAGPAWEAVR